MKIRFQQLFSISLSSSFYKDKKIHGDLIIDPTGHSQKLMSRYRILSKKTSDGLALLYECSPLINDNTPFKPIKNEEKFTFILKSDNADFWFYSDVRNWESGKIFFLTNPTYSATGDINIVSAPLSDPILFRPMDFNYEVLLENTEGLLEIRNSSGLLLKTHSVRAKGSAEPAVVKEKIQVNLNHFADGLYILRYKSASGITDEKVYCSEDFSNDSFAILEITYRGNAAWTGVEPFQNYIIRIDSRKADWYFDIRIRKRAVPVIKASKLSINHLNVPPDVKRTFTVDGLPDDANGIVKFKSTVKLSYSQVPMRLQLINTTNSKVVMDPLPLPSSVDLQKDTLNNLFTQVIINV
jgi:hypothetical protein